MDWDVRGWGGSCGKGFWVRRRKVQCAVWLKWAKAKPFTMEGTIIGRQLSKGKHQKSLSMDEYGAFWIFSLGEKYSKFDGQNMAVKSVKMRKIKRSLEYGIQEIKTRRDAPSIFRSIVLRPRKPAVGYDGLS